MKDEERIQKCKDRTLKSFNPIYSYLCLMLNPVALFTCLRTFIVIIKDFFLLQFFEKFHIYKIPIIHVDHKLDEKIPFIPEKIKIYLDFINYWVRPFSMLKDRVGFYKGALALKKWMRIFRKLYKVAGQIYYFRLTTTNRPDYKETKEFRKIHRLDPHYLCVPSLHIATIILVYGFYRQYFDEENFTQEEKNRWLGEMYSDCMKIADSVLYVKQHSVNCVPAALYMVVSNFEEFVKIEDARKFLDDMFKNPENFTEENAIEVKDFMKNALENYLIEQKSSENWYEPVRNFLLNYKKNN